MLLTSWAGGKYAWGSPVIVGLGIVTVVLGVAFLLVERRAVEPAMPLRLFRIRTVALSSIVLFLVGVCMFGAVTYLPTFLQIANGASASNAGLLLVPLMFGILGSSILAGQIISRTGRYRVFPIAGMAVATLGMYLLSTLGVDSTRFESGAYMAILGIGIGMVMQILVLAVQNEAPIEDLGVATSTVGFFRAVGGSVGVAAFGALFTSRLTAILGAKADLHITPEVVRGLAPSARATTALGVRRRDHPGVHVRRAAAVARLRARRASSRKRHFARLPEMSGARRCSRSTSPRTHSSRWPTRHSRSTASTTAATAERSRRAARRGHHRDPRTARTEEGGDV